MLTPWTAWLVAFSWAASGKMGELKACLEDALSGRGRLVTLVGEPGIGKTRTAQELATYAGLRSAQVLWGRCYEEQGMPPYLALSASDSLIRAGARAGAATF